MYSIIAFLITLVQMTVTLVSYGMQLKIVFYDMVLYGAPFYLMKGMFNADSALKDENPLYMWFIAFHLIKYFVFFRAQVRDDSNVFRNGAILLEAAYLMLSAYYII